MYKRRNRLGKTPALGAHSISSQSSNSSVNVAEEPARKRSTSPKNLFEYMSSQQSPLSKKLRLSQSENRKENDEDIVVESPQKPTKRTTKEVLEMLTSSQESDRSHNRSQVERSQINLNSSLSRRHLFSTQKSSVSQKPLLFPGKDLDNKISRSQVSFSQQRTVPKSFMEDLLNNAGMILTKNGSPNVLTTDQAVFIRNVEKAFNNHKEKEDLEKWTDKFIEDFENYFKDPESIKISLSPSKADYDNFTQVDTQNNLVRLLLSVECLQVKLIEFLLAKFADLTSDEDNPNAEGEDSVFWVKMFLQPLRYLNRVVDPVTLTKRLFELIYISSNLLVHHEVISCVPDIIDDKQHKEVAKELIEIMRNEPLLTPSVLVSLENLSLEVDSAYELQIGLIKALRRAKLEHLPAFVRFIITGDCPSHIDELINGLRSELSICPGTGSTQTQSKEKETDVQSVQTVIFDRLRDAVLGSRKLAVAWSKNIAKQSTASKHTPMDVIMLLILHSTSTDLIKKRFIESVIRSKIKAGLFLESLIKDTFSNHMTIVKQYFKDLIKVTSALLQSVDQSVSKFGAFIYMECFQQFEGRYCKSVIFELVDLIEMNSGNAKAPLALLHTLTAEHTQKISPYVTRIMLLFECVTELPVVEVRLLMDILCMVAYGDPDDAAVDMLGLQGELYMIIQKQLACHNDISLFRSGIVCTIIAIKHMVGVPEGEINETPDSEQENIPLSARATKAFNLLDMVLVGARSNREASLVLTYDQLSYIIMTSENLEKCFIKKVSLLMQDILQNHYIIASSDFSKKEDRLEASLQYCIDTDIEDPVALNLSEAVIKEESGTNTHRCVGLPSLLRVVRSLEMADLTEIDALLGCALVMPSPAVINQFGTQDVTTQKLVLDCLFHAANWFREVLNCFVYMIKEGKPEKVLMRFRLLVHLQSSISNRLPQAMDYSPPNYYYNLPSSRISSQIEKSKRVNRKKGKKKSEKEKDVEGNEEGDGEEAAPDTDDENEDQVEAVEFDVFRQHLRELDFDVCLILTQSLTITPTPIKDGNCSAEFGPSELRLLLEDLAAKLKFSLHPKKAFPGKAGPDVVGFDNLSIVPVHLIVRNFSKLSSHLTGHLQKLVEFSHNLIKVHDGIWDAPGMFGQGSAEIKQSVSLLLTTFNTYLSWSDIKAEENSKLLINTISNLGGLGKGKAGSLNEAVQACVTYLTEISTCMMDLPSILSLVTLIKTLISFYIPGEEKLNVNLEVICEEALKRRWYDTKGNELKVGPGVNSQEAALLELYLGSGSETLARVAAILNWLVDEAEVLGTEASLTTFPHFNKTNLNLMIQALSKGLTNATKCSLEGKDLREQLGLWDKVMTCLQELVVVVKAQDTKLNLRHFLKGCSPLLKLFLSQGINVCSIMFKMESLVVPQMLKKLQVVTRYIQTVCNYSKVSKDSSMIQQLPVVRGILESILLAVKNMVLKNKCVDAFFMGSMKNKDLKGDVIVSQDEDEDEESARRVEEPLQVPEEEECDGASTSAPVSSGDASDVDSEGNISDTC